MNKDVPVWWGDDGSQMDGYTAYVYREPYWFVPSACYEHHAVVARDAALKA